MPFHSCIVSTGGGVVLKRENWGLMQHGIVVWLSGDPTLLAARAMRDDLSSRPLLARQQPQTQAQPTDAVSSPAPDLPSAPAPEPLRPEVLPCQPCRHSQQDPSLFTHLEDMCSRV